MEQLSPLQVNRVRLHPVSSVLGGQRDDGAFQESVATTAPDHVAVEAPSSLNHHPAVLVVEESATRPELEPAITGGGGEAANTRLAGQKRNRDEPDDPSKSDDKRRRPNPPDDSGRCCC